jgi:hypothetical protein
MGARGDTANKESKSTPIGLVRKDIQKLPNYLANQGGLYTQADPG